LAVGEALESGRQCLQYALEALLVPTAAHVSKGGSVRMPMQETFFAKRFGMLVDQFGVPWMINAAEAA
jgi:uncharacterized glyoxalase superfamily protein PhnB